jgi:hypothetical protein
MSPSLKAVPGIEPNTQNITAMHDVQHSNYIISGLQTLASFPLSTLKPELNANIKKFSYLTKKKHFFIKNKQLMLLREIITVYFENHTKHRYNV